MTGRLFESDESRGLCECAHHRRVHIFGASDGVGSCLHIDPRTGQYCLCSRFRPNSEPASFTANKPIRW